MGEALLPVTSVNPFSSLTFALSQWRPHAVTSSAWIGFPFFCCRSECLAGAEGGLSSLGRNGCGSCSGFRVPGNCVIVGCPFYRRLLLIGLLCLSVSVKMTLAQTRSKRGDTSGIGPGGAVLGQDLLTASHLLSSVAFQTMKSSFWKEVCAGQYPHSLQCRLRCLVRHWMGLGSVWVG